MKKLLTETKAELRTEGYTPEDIVFIGSRDGEYACSWEEFERLADFNYYDGFGEQKVADDLLIRMRDGAFFYRDEYDGAEAWGFWPVPVIRENPRRITTLKTGPGYSLANINGHQVDREES